MYNPYHRAPEQKFVEAINKYIENQPKKSALKEDILIFIFYLIYGILILGFD